MTDVTISNESIWKDADSALLNVEKDLWSDQMTKLNLINSFLIRSFHRHRRRPFDGQILKSTSSVFDSEVAIKNFFVEFGGLQIGANYKLKKAP